MIKTCGTKHPLTLQGLDRAQNYMSALSSGFAPYDEREIQDHLVFLQRVSKYINYFDGESELPIGVWSEQIEKDEAMVLSKAVTLNMDFVWTQWTSVISSLVAGNSQNNMKKQWAYVFDLVFNGLRVIDELNERLASDSELHVWLMKRTAHITPILKRWLAYYKTSIEVPDPSNNLFDHEYSLSEIFEGWMKIESKDDLQYSQLWYPEIYSSFGEYYDAIPKDKKPFLGITQAPVSPKDFISLGVHYAGFIETGKMLLGFLAQVVRKANNSFLNSLETNTHQPHIGILLAFAELTHPIKNELNDLVKRQHDYYLANGLKVTPSSAKKDGVYITAELAKLTENVLVKSDTLLKGGKDGDGNDILYSADTDTILNKAAVAEIKGYFRAGNQLHVGNSATADGVEAELEFPEEGWSPFGSPNFGRVKAGVALSSDNFRLQEGKRTITLKFSFLDNLGLSSSSIKNKTQVFYTGDEGWQNIVLAGDSVSVSGKVLTIELNIPEDHPPAVDFDTKIHERSIFNNKPVLEIYFEDSLIYALRSAQMVSVQNKVKVEGLKQLTLANKLGSLDGSKAFLPLGPSPETGDFMVIGSSEVFSKKVASGKLKMNWKINQSFSGKTWASAWTNISILDKNNWVRPKQPRVDYLQFTSLLNGSVFEFNHEALIGKEESDVYTTQSHSGFLKFLLYNTMGHETYPTQYLRQAMRIAKNPDTSETLPEKPYVPEIDGISIDYTTSWEELKLTKTNKEVSDKLEFYHITPFGTHPAHGNDLDQDNPNFVWNAANEGELFVGFKDSVPGSSLNVLFSIVEGSSNPLKKAPDVKWSYLEDNQWKSFETDKLIDSTNGLIQTGIVTAEIPLRFKDPGTHMGSDLFWIKAEVSQDPDAVCNILAISAQAFSATLFCEEIAEGHFEEPLEEGTVKKFLDPITGIKKIHQPLASFGGKKKEDEATFKNRISQRSRHKDRSVEMLDYEQLVLQEFDEIKRVRCITHTKYEENETTGVVDYSESAPGHITLITLPNFWDKDEIKRYTAISTLENVKSHLQAKLSPFVNLHVKNPIYYEVRLEFNVKFNDDILEKEFYKAQLHAELIEFLSPFNSGVRKTIFQSTINKAEVIDFIDERHYVNYLKNLVMDVIIDPLKPSENQLNIETAKTNIQAALLVSAKEHTIKVIT